MLVRQNASSVAGALQFLCVFTLIEATVISYDASLPSEPATSSSTRPDTDTIPGSCSNVVVNNGHGNCHCSPLAEIRCRNLTGVPEFRPDGTLYSTAYLDHQEINTLPPAAFRHLRVSRIVLNFNPLVAGLSPNGLRGLEASVRELELGACQLVDLPDGLLNGMSGLRRLHLWANQIRRIPGGFFGGADGLWELLLWGNELDELDELSLGGLWNLRRLDLDRNRLTTVSKGIFRHLLELHSLRLSDNLLESLFAETFGYMESLKSLSLDRNRITYIHERAFVGLSTLLSLSMSGNRIGFLPNELFAPLVSLVVLRLDDNHIEYVWPRTFIGLGQLRRLDLSGNQIGGLPEMLGGLPDGALRHSPLLQRVVLDNNRLTTLKRCSVATDAADMPPYLRTLSLVGNPLYCDCRLAWLLDVGKPGTAVWWAPCRGGTDDNRTDIVRHHSYYDLSRDACISAHSHRCPFNR